MGIIVLFGWKIARLAFGFYLVNCVVFWEDRSKLVLGLQVMVAGVLLGVGTFGNSLERAYEEVSEKLEKSAQKLEKKAK